jgi:hypothetical protein
MSQRSLAALILVNAVLLAALALATVGSDRAQAQGLGPRGTQYMMIAGEVANRPQVEGLYFINRENSRMFAATYDSRNDNFNVVGNGRIISEDVRRGGDR